MNKIHTSKLVNENTIVIELTDGSKDRNEETVVVEKLSYGRNKKESISDFKKRVKVSIKEALHTRRQSTESVEDIDLN